MSWLYLLIAGLLEVLGVIWLNQYARSKQKFYIVLMAITFIFSFSFFKISYDNNSNGNSICYMDWYWHSRRSYCRYVILQRINTF